MRCSTVDVLLAAMCSCRQLGSADLASDLEPTGLGVDYIRQTVGNAHAAHSPQGPPECSSSGGDADGSDGGSGGDGGSGDTDGKGDACDDGGDGGDSAPALASPRGVVKLGGGHRCTCSLAQSVPLLSLLGMEERAAIANALHAHCGGGGDGHSDSGRTGRQLSSLFGVQVALRFPLAPFADGVVDGDAALPGLLARSIDWHTDVRCSPPYELKPPPQQRAIARNPPPPAVCDRT